MKKIIIIIIFLITIINNLASAQWRTLPWNHDKFNSKWGSGIISQYDKLEHLTCYTTATIILDDWKLPLALGVAWEVKDALIPYEKYGRFWGGGGFSYKDMAANIAGIGVGLFIKRVVFDKWLFPINKNNK
ncbi:MAG TPA: hypothetical protein PKZ16_02025 [bacterium]|nr:hypothetical protein [bacterium]HPL95850.1 hypothetical protein [bacterium]